MNKDISSRENNRRVFVGKVVSNKMDKTVKVFIERKYKHAKYEKIVLGRTVAIAHNENHDISVGDTVKIMESRPLSKTKKWIVVAKVN